VATPQIMPLDLEQAVEAIIRGFRLTLEEG
jgi:hypothetical protein